MRFNARTVASCCAAALIGIGVYLWSADAGESRTDEHHEGQADPDWIEQVRGDGIPVVLRDAPSNPWLSVAHVGNWDPRESEEWIASTLPEILQSVQATAADTYGGALGFRGSQRVVLALVRRDVADRFGERTRMFNPLMAGAYSLESRTCFVVDRATMDSDSTCAHELMHALSHERWSNLPVWLDEGVADTAKHAWQKSQGSQDGVGVAIVVRRIARNPKAIPRFSFLVEAESPFEVVDLIERQLTEVVSDDDVLRSMFDATQIHASARELAHDLCAAMVAFVRAGLDGPVDVERLASVGVSPADAEVDIDLAFREFLTSTASSPRAGSVRLVYGDERTKRRR